MSDLSGSTLQSLFDAALHDYEKQTGMKLIEDPLAGQLENCNSVESIITVLQEQARAFTNFRRDDERVMKPLKRVVHVTHVLSTSLPFPHANAISAAFAILLRSIKDVSASYDALVDLLESIEQFLSRLDIYIRFPPTAPTTAMGEIIVKIMVELLSTIALVTKQIKQKQPLKLIKKFWGEKEVEAVLHRLDRLTQDEARTTAAQTLEVVYGLVQNMRVVMDDGKASEEGIQKALEMMQDIASEINKSQREKLLRDTRKWLAPPDPWENHNSAQESHYEGTSSWFVHGNAYGEWKSSGSNSHLWIHGKPGAGKSILCSTIIEDIDHMRKSGLASLAFFYCDFRDDDKRNLRGLLSSLLAQFCHSSDAYSAILSDFYSKHDNGLRHPSDNALVGCLKSILKHPGHAPVYVIIDALDECPNTFGMPTPREKVIKFVEELVNLTLTNLHICITSRPEADITVSLDPLSFNQISLHAESGQVQDIVNYIKYVVHGDPKMKRWRVADKELVIEVLTNKVDGMFRWAFCQFDVLRRCLPARIRQVLDELPESLDGTYERMLQDIDKANWKFALRLFQCVAVASRPLRVEELAELLAFDFDAGPIPTFQAGWQPEDPISAVLSTCPNFLSIVKAEGSASIQFSHFSVKEFLTSNRLAETRDIISRYHVSMNPAHTIVAQACLGILLHLDENITDESLKSFPLAEYAAKNWVNHARFDNVSANTQNGVKRLFDPRRPHFTILVWIYDPEYSWLIRSERPSQPRGTCLHYATLSGLPNLVKFLVAEFKPDLDAQCFFNAVTPLHLASRDGHVEVARVLLEHGADVDAQDISKWTPLRHALDKKRVEVARVLVENKAYMGAQGMDRWMPLYWASRHGQAEMAQMLLEHGADMDSNNVYGWTPYRRAVYEGHTEVVRVFDQHKLAGGLQNKSKTTLLHDASREGNARLARELLNNGADTNARDESNLTPLHLASKGGCIEVAQVLLEHGADANVRNENKSTPLHFALRCSCHSYNEFLGVSSWKTCKHSEVALVLLERGADASAQDRNRSIPLHLALQGGHIKVARMLLEHGADASVQDENKSTPLHWASERGQVEIARALLEHGADASAQDKKIMTPLHWALERGHTDVALLLLEHGADASAQDRNRSIPLHLALQGGHIKVARVLLEHGADASARDENKSTPLHWASERGQVEFARALLEHGADASAQDKNNITPLHRASERGHTDVALVLLEHGADASAQDRNRSISLHLALQGGHFKVARELLEHGADASARDENKSTPLHWVSERGQVEFARALLEHGADASARDKNNTTPLHWASERGHTDVARVLLEHGTDASAQDKSNVTPLHCVSGGHVEVALALLEHGANASALDKNHSTPLHWASERRDVKIALVLLEHNADASAPNKDKVTPLHLASPGGYIELALVLLEHGADASARDKDNLTPLHWASERGHVEFARALLKYGADTSARDKNNSTPLQVALRCSCRIISIEFLQASSCEHLEVARVLLEYGADANAGLTQLQREWIARLPGITHISTAQEESDNERAMMEEQFEEIEGGRVIMKRERMSERDEESEDESVTMKRARMGERDQESD